MSLQRACALDDLTPERALAVQLTNAAGDDIEVAVVRDGDDVYAINDLCSHAAINLSEGDVEGCEIECWLHGSRFDLRTGKPLSFPATEAVATYPVSVQGDDVLVDVDAPHNS